MGETVQIDQPQVSKIGNAVLDVADRLARISAEAGRAGAITDSAVPGSQALGATSGFASGWERQLSDLAGQVRGFGDNLHKAAGDYHRADSDAADGF